MKRDKWREHSNDNFFDRFESDYDGEESSRERSPTNGVSYIEHHVSKFDTLAGVAIKYGVEVADVKKMNSLVTDHQMFALKTLHIPLPGRHPPSPCLSNGSNTPTHGNLDHSPPVQAHRDLFESFQSLRIKSSRRKVSPAMSSLQGYYGLRLTSSPSEDGSFSRNTPMSDRPLSRHRKSKSLVNVILEGIMEKSDTTPGPETMEVVSGKWNDKLIQRRQKSVADFTRIPELLMRDDNSSSGGLPSRKGKGLALRQKAVSRIAMTNDFEPIGLSPVAMSVGDASLNDGSSSGVRKSSSTSCLQDQDNTGSSSIWPTSMWSLKPDLQALSTAAIGKPIFDGLPKPLTGRKNKAALD
ncbi:LysM and putative peptidoglycan-binding domain-containing protein 2, partial [Mucuna pruriens]